MSPMELIILLIIAGVCGAIAQSLSGFSRGGCLTAIALGFIGSLLGAWLARATGLPEIFSIQVGDESFPIVWSIIGGALFAAALGLISSRNRKSD